MRNTVHTLLQPQGILQTYSAMASTRMWHCAFIGVHHAHKILSALRWLVAPILPLRNSVLARQTMMALQHGSEKQTAQVEHGVYQQTQAGFKLPAPVRQNRLLAKPQQIVEQRLAVQTKAVKRHTLGLMFVLTHMGSQSKVRGH